MIRLSCPQCGAALSPLENKGVWCESCSKEIPTSVLQAAIASADVARKQENLQKQWAFVGCMMTGVLLGIVALIASRLLFNFPPPSQLPAWFIGSGIGGGIFLSGIYVVLASRKSEAVTVGLYLVFIVSFVLGALTLVMSFVYWLSK